MKRVKNSVEASTRVTTLPAATIGRASPAKAAVGDIDDRQVAEWMRQAAAIPGFGKR
jgi:hypothetical protein